MAAEALQGLEVIEAQPDEVDVDTSRKIGSGSSCEVFRGVWREQVVAVKQMQEVDYAGQSWGPDTPSSPFTREIYVMSRAKHPNLVALFSCISVNKPYSVVMELCAGGSVAEYIHLDVEQEESPFTWMQTVRILKHTAAAVKYLHDLDPPILHRDLKSANMLLVEPVRSKADVPHTKLCDFGVARTKSRDGEQMTARTTNDEWPMMTKQVGTCNWVAPEVFYGHCYNEKIDTYAFGMVCFEMIFHEVPFEECENAPEIMQLVLHKKRPALDDPPFGTPDGMLKLTELCWSHFPENRPSFQEVCNLLEAFPG